jgi:hypothetical protein
VKIIVATTVSIERSRPGGDELVESHTYVHEVDQGDNLMFLAEGAATGLTEVGNKVLEAIELQNRAHPKKGIIRLRPTFREPEPTRP